MRTGLLAALVLGLTAVATGVSFVLHIRAPVVATAIPTCSGPAGAAQRVLVVGDSWAGDGRLDLETARTARVCSVGYSGLNSQDVLASFAQDRDALAIVTADLGHATDAVALVGVNDATQHRGPAFYADGVRQLAAHLGTIADRVFVLELPATRVTGQLAPEVAIPSAIFACLNDGCSGDVTASYRAAAANLPLTLIDYDQLAPAFDPADLAPDGLHPTALRYAELSRIIANAVTAP